MPKQERIVIDSERWTGDLAADEMRAIEVQKERAQFWIDNPRALASILIAPVAIAAGSIVWTYVWRATSAPIVRAGDPTIGYALLSWLIIGGGTWLVNRSGKAHVSYASGFGAACLGTIFALSAMYWIDVHAPPVRTQGLGHVYVDGIREGTIIPRRHRPWPTSRLTVSFRDSTEQFAIRADSVSAWRHKSVCLDAVISSGRWGFEFLNATPIFIRPRVEGAWLVGNEDRRECLKGARPPV